MRHGKAGYKLKRDISARRALLRGLVTNVIEEERITTTVQKAKAARPLVERMITLQGPLDDAQRQRLLEIADRCPVHRTLTSEISIQTRLA